MIHLVIDNYKGEFVKENVVEEEFLVLGVEELVEEEYGRWWWVGERVEGLGVIIQPQTPFHHLQHNHHHLLQPHPLHTQQILIVLLLIDQQEDILHCVIEVF